MLCCFYFLLNKIIISFIIILQESKVKSSTKKRTIKASLNKLGSSKYIEDVTLINLKYNTKYEVYVILRNVNGMNLPSPVYNFVTLKSWYNICKNNIKIMINIDNLNL